jgi:O-antigen ligase
VREHLVALCYILAIATSCFFVLAKPMRAQLIAPADFARRRNAWFVVTLVTFLSHNFWLALLLCAVVVAIAARYEKNVTALYCVLVLAVPQYNVQIPGFGLVNWLFEINYQRTLAIALLLPAAARLLGEQRLTNPRLRVADGLLLMLFAYTFVVNFTADSITGMMRFTVHFLLDHALLYYVVSRSITTRRQLYDTLASFTVALAVIGVLALFETVRHWIMYDALRPALGLPPEEFTNYLMRLSDDGVGYLRAYVTAGHALALGIVMMMGVCLQIALVSRYAAPWFGALVVSMLAAGLAASVSRGPWLACAIAVALGMAFGPGALKRIGWTALLLPVVILGLLIHPAGDKVIDLLPFIGTVERSSVTYRTQLIDAATQVFWQNPVFGSLHFITNPALEVMRQGQGIIDIVNTYLGMALAYGIVGMVLFVAPSAYALVMCVATSRRLAPKDSAAEAIGRALGATMLGFMLALGAMSYYFTIPVVHWLLLSLCLAYVAHAPSWQRAPAAQRAASPAVPASSLQRRPSV